MAKVIQSKTDILSKHTRTEIDHWIAKFPEDRKKIRCDWRAECSPTSK